MLMTQRITFFACYFEQRKKSNEHEISESIVSFEYVTIWDYLAYCLFFPIVLYSPSNEYDHFCKFIRGYYIHKFIKVFILKI